MVEKIDLTSGGRFEVSPFVNDKKFLKMAEMVSAMNSGGFAAERATTDLREVLTTTDGIHSFAALANARNLPKWDAAPRQWQKIASVETVDDFEPVTFERLDLNLSDGLKSGLGNGGKRIAPKVREGGTYQETFGFTEESVKAQIEKRGFRTSLTLERILSRLRPTVRELPDAMLQIALDTDEALVMDALQLGASSTTHQTAGTAPISGATVPANAPFSIDALRLALSQVAARVDAYGNPIQLANSYYIVVRTGLGESVQAALDFARQLNGVRQDIAGGQLIYGGLPQGNLGRVTGVIESPWITDADAWYVVPAAGSSFKTGLVKLQLAGRTAPEILVSNFTGTLIRGGSGSSPFDLCSFDADVVSVKHRQFTSAALITQEQIVWSNGSGS